MLRDLVSQARSAATSSSAGDLEAITAERDFFREKYAEQMNVMEHLNGQLKQSQRIIDKLRSQILDLEMEKSSTNIVNTNNIGCGMGSGSSSVTCLTSCEDGSVKSKSIAGDSDADVVKVIETAVDDEVSEINNSIPTTTNNAQDVGSPTPTDNQKQSKTIELGESEESGDLEKEGEDSDDEDEDDDDDDDIDRIRANAERMLMWANYQTSKRSTPNTSILSQEDDDNESKYSETSTRRSQATPTTKGTVSAGGDAIVYSLPTSLDKRQISSEDEDSDNSTLGSSSRNQPEQSVGSWRSSSGTSATTNNEKSGKIGKLFNNLKDMIDGGASESEESESSVDDDESTDSNFADRVIVQAEL